MSISDFERHLLIFHGNFLRRDTRSAVFVQGYRGYRSYDAPDWDECEAQVLRVMLSFLGVMGVLDIAYSELTERFKLRSHRYDWYDEDGDGGEGDNYCVGISGFRITPLGAWILGLGGAYAETGENMLQESGGGLVVQPDYTVVMTGMETRIAHEPFLSAFLTRQTVEEHVLTYKIDFASVVRAYNQGIMPKEIESYLKKAGSRPLDDSIIRSFDGWQAKIGRVSIRTVTLLEADDELLLEELVHTKSIEKYLGERIRNAAVIIDVRETSGVKTAMEKSGWLVRTADSATQGGKGRRTRRA